MTAILHLPTVLLLALRQFIAMLTAFFDNFKHNLCKTVPYNLMY